MAARAVALAAAEEAVRAEAEQAVPEEPVAVAVAEVRVARVVPEEPVAVAGQAELEEREARAVEPAELAQGRACSTTPTIP